MICFLSCKRCTCADFMKKQFAIATLLLLVSLPSCGRKKKKTSTAPQRSHVQTEVDIPTASDDSIRSFFDGDVGEFALADDGAKNAAVPSDRDFAWVEESNKDNPDSFKVVYFDFDSFRVRDDQDETLRYNIALAKKKLEETDGALGNDQKPTIVIDGHSCHSAGSHIYNLALSERRAKVLADKFMEAGIPSECIKIVGRGMEMPAMVNGKLVDGGREDQWPNRRDEMRIIYS